MSGLTSYGQIQLPIYLVFVEALEEKGMRKGFDSWKDRLFLELSCWWYH
jgi:hypothetical protein